MVQLRQRNNFKGVKIMKKVLLALLALCLVLSVNSPAALAMYDDNEPKGDYPVDPPVGLTLTYNGKEQIGVLTSEGSSYINYYGYDVVNYKATDAGTYTATAILWGDMGPQSFVWSDGTKADKKIKFTIKKAKNPLTVKAKTAKVDYSALKRKDQKIARKKALSVSKAKGAVAYTKQSGSKKISISKKTGKITVKKGLKKGTYKLKIKVAAKGDKNYKAATKKVTVKIVIK